MSDNTITIDESDLEQLVEQKVQERAAEIAEQTGASRRRVLASLAGIAGAGALGYSGGQRVAADPSDAAGTVYFEQVGDSNNPVSKLYVDQEFAVDENIDADTVEMKDGQVSNTLSLDDDPTDDQSWALLDDANDLRLNFLNGNLSYPWLSFRTDTDILDIGGSVYDVDLDLNSGNIDNVGSVSAENINSVAQVTDPQNLQSAIDDAAAEHVKDTSHRALVRIVGNHDNFNVEEVTIPPGVVLDARGTELFPGGSYMLEIDGGAHVLGHGAVIRAYSYAGDLFLFDHSDNSVGSNNPATVTGYPQVWGANDGQWCVKSDNSAGNGVSGINVEVGCRNAGGLVQILNGGGYTNNCRFAFIGSTAPASDQRVIDLGAATAKQVAGNVIEAPSVCQVKSGAQFVNMNRAFYNTVRGQFADPVNATEAGRNTVEFGNATGGNAVRLDRQYTIPGDEILRSADAVNTVGPENRPWMAAVDLSGRSAENIGVMAYDDGTNTAGQGVPCRWVDTDGDGTGDAWQPFDGSATFS
jgi:hypothetical protein